LKPTLVVSRKTIDEDLSLTGITSEKVEMTSQVHGLISASIFDSCFETILILDIARCREAVQCAGLAVI
jgi:hypothetical protein